MSKKRLGGVHKPRGLLGSVVKGIDSPACYDEETGEPTPAVKEIKRNWVESVVMIALSAVLVVSSAAYHANNTHASYSLTLDGFGGDVVAVKAIAMDAADVAALEGDPRLCGAYLLRYAGGQPLSAIGCDEEYALDNLPDPPTIVEQKGGESPATFLIDSSKLVMYAVERSDGSGETTLWAGPTFESLASGAFVPVPLAGKTSMCSARPTESETSVGFSSVPLFARNP